jgi:hypothetical protein
MVNKEGKIKFDNWQRLYHSFIGFLLSKGFYDSFSIELNDNLNMSIAAFVKRVVEFDLCLIEDMIITAVEFNEENSDFWNDVNYEWLEHCKMFQRTKPKQKYFNSIW